MIELTSDQQLQRALERSPTIAVVGAHIDPAKAGHYVPAYLHEQGYDIRPVNPNYLGHTLWGQPVRASLAEIETAIDLIDIFRRSDRVADHLDEILALTPRPQIVWLQLGVRDNRVANALMDAGINVVQDRCTLAEHRRLGLASPTRQ